MKTKNAMRFGVIVLLIVSLMLSSGCAKETPTFTVDTTADGVVGRLNLVMSGLGDFKGEDLAVQSADVVLSGAGNATMWVIEELTANISGAGSLDYYGNPDLLDTDVSGIGNLSHKGDK